MNSGGLLAYYNRVADAPDAIARLRRFVLDLTVHGRLVPQNSTDEPAAALLTRIRTERSRSVKGGAVKRTESEHEFVGPFNLPHSWEWACLGDVAEYGLSEKVVSNSDISVDTWVLDLEDIEKGTSKLIERVPSSMRPFRSTKTVFKQGDVLFGKLRPYLNKCLVADQDGVCTTEIVPIRGYCGLVPEYLRLVLKSPLTMSRVDRLMYGMKMPRLGTDDALQLAFPLPPLAEQYRIVAKVDELTTLCDWLEAARARREAARDQLTTASLTCLHARKAETFRDDVRFALKALPAITARPDQIKLLRQFILKLAVRGQLVAQNPEDEPTSELLKRIAVDIRDKQIAKRIRPQKPAMPAANLEAQVTIPAGWQHVYLQELAYQITDGTHLTPKYTEQGKPFLSAQNVKPFKFMPEKHRFVSEMDFDKYRANRRPERGDILLTRVGAGIGEAAVLNSDFEFAFYVSLCLIKIPSKLLSAEYLTIWLNSPEGRESSKARTYGKDASQGNLNLGLIRTFKVPIPPLAEQLRIVTKVDELMTLCDRLESNLTILDDTRHFFLEALLAEALGRNNQVVACDLARRGEIR